MTSVDLIIAAVLLVSGLAAAYRGLVHQVTSILSGAIAAIATAILFGQIRGDVRARIDPDWAADIAGIVGLFLIVFVPASFIGYRISEAIKSSAVGPLDRSLGFVFGVIRGLVLVAAGYLLYTWIVPSERQPQWVQTAKLLPLVKSTGSVLTSFVSGSGQKLANLPPIQSRKPQARAEEPRAEQEPAPQPERVFAPSPPASAPRPQAPQASVPPMIIPPERVPPSLLEPTPPNKPVAKPAVTAQPKERAKPARAKEAQTRSKPKPSKPKAQAAQARPRPDAPASGDKKPGKGYGERDRKALDQLVRSANSAQ